MSRRRLSTPAVITAAREVLDSDGLSGLSMRRVGQRLNVEAMSLYHYVASRDALVNGVVELVLHDLQQELDSQPDPLDSWADYLSTLAHRIRRFSREHPHGFELIATRPTQQFWLRPPLRSLPGLEAFLAALRLRGLSDTAALYAYRAFTSFLLGHLLLEPQGLTATSLSTEGQPPAGPRPAAHDALTADLLDQQAYPNVAQLARQLHEDHTDREFALGLSDLLSRVDRESCPPHLRSA